MPLDGLRAWIGELERKLGARTRVGLVLVAIAVGGAGAAIYLALDSAEKDASKNEVHQVQTRLDQLGGTSSQSGQLESRVAAAEAAAKTAQAEVVKLEVEVKALQAQSKGSKASGTKK
jgi:uncharacterized protein HemX